MQSMAYSAFVYTERCVNPNSFVANDALILANVSFEKDLEAGEETELQGIGPWAAERW